MICIGKLFISLDVNYLGGKSILVGIEDIVG